MNEQPKLSEVQKQSIDSGLVSGLGVADIAGVLKVSTEEVLSVLPEIVERWRAVRLSMPGINERRLDVVMNRIWAKVNEGNIYAADLFYRILAMPPAEAEDPQLARLLAELTDKTTFDKKALAAYLENLAQKGGFASVYYDLRNAEPPLPPKQAFFCAWYQVYQGNRDLLRLVPGMPWTITGLCAFLGVSNTTLHTWKNKHNRELGLESFLDHALGDLIPQAVNQLGRNIRNPNGHVSNKAIEMTLDWHEKRQDKKIKPAQAGAPAGDGRGIPLIDPEMQEEELDVLIDNLVIARRRPESNFRPAQFSLPDGGEPSGEDNQN